MSEPVRLRFDDSLPALVDVISAELGKDNLEQGRIARDTSGRLRFLSSANAPSDERRNAIEEKIAASLGPYATESDAIGFADEPGVRRWLDDSSAFPLKVNGFQVQLLDRRIVGSTWTESPSEGEVVPPRIVFASLKGGVGRSTALAVTASDLAHRNQNVLIFDLDLEAPGVGGMLLDDERTPRFGTVDFLVENGLRSISDRDLSDFVGTSTLTSAGGGQVDVVPALGSTAVRHPYNTLSKLSRALIEDIAPSGESISVSAKIREMVDRFSGRERYDVVLIDSRAGLSEITAPAILGLGATVLFFGTAQQQTIQGYGALFAALKLLAERARRGGSRAEWRLLFKAVLAKAGKDPTARDWYRDEMYEVFAENLYDEDAARSGDANPISFDIDDPDAPHFPLLIPFDAAFVEFDPSRTPSQLDLPFYEAAYRPFLDSIDAMIRASWVSQDEPEDAE